MNALFCHSSCIQTLTEQHGVSIATAIVKSTRGVDTLVQVGQKYCTTDLQSLSSVWKTLHSIVYVKDSLSLMEPKQQMKILDAALHCLEKLKDGNIKAESILYRIMKTLKKLVENDKFFRRNIVALKEKQFVSRCISALQRKTEQGKIFSTGDDACTEATIQIIIECVTKGDDKSIVVDTDWKAFVPFCISALVTFGDCGEVQRSSLWLLKRAVEEIDTKPMATYTFILETFSLLLKSEKVSDSVKKEARDVVSNLPSVA